MNTSANHPLTKQGTNIKFASTMQKARCFEFDWRFYALSAYYKAITIQSFNLFSPVMMIVNLMNESMRKPTTGTGCHTLFDNWYVFFSIPSCTDTAGMKLPCRHNKS